MRLEVQPAGVVPFSMSEHDSFESSLMQVWAFPEL
jgi:hypothetical protein